MPRDLPTHRSSAPRRPDGEAGVLRRLAGAIAVVLLVFALGLPGGGCTRADTAISIGRCPSGEIMRLQVTVRQRGAAIQGTCPGPSTAPSYTLERPCDTSSQFELPHLADGQELLFWFRRSDGKASYCETCKEGARTNTMGTCSLQGPPPCEDSERCGNQIDDNCDGQIDEGCPTEPTTEPGSEPGKEPGSELASEPPAEPPNEIAPEPMTEPDQEPKSEPALEPDAEPIAEPMADDAGPVDTPDAGEATAELTTEPTTDAGEPIPEGAACDGGEPGCGEPQPDQGGHETSQESSSGDGQTGRCSGDGDCNGGLCIDSRCSVASALCTTDATCQAHERCLKMGCHKVAALCISSADCPNQESCEAGICKDCSAGLCQQPAACDPANKNACTAGFSCTGSVCLRQCQSGSLPRGTCPDLPRMICRTNSGHSVGTCVLGCSSSQQCPQMYTCQIDPVTAVGLCVR